MGSKTSSQQNTNSSTLATPQAATDYTNVINRATSAANLPYQAYSGELTAGVNSQENLATGALNGLGAAGNSYFNNASYQGGLGAASVQPGALGAAQINQYMSPYQSDVISATQAQIANQDAQQQQQQTSNAIGAGAFGGDRAGVAQATLAGQQAIANNSTLANLNNQNYAQALQTAQGQQQLGLGAAQADRAAVQQNAQLQAGLGSASTAAGLGVANAQLGAGALQQQTAQAGDTAQYGQFEQAQAFPYQQAQYLAGITDATAPNYGTLSNSQSTTQTSGLNSVLGGLLGLGTALYPKARGGAVAEQGLGGARFVLMDAADAKRLLTGLGAVGLHSRGLEAARASGGSVGLGGAPYSDGAGYVPSPGLGAARMPMAPQQSSGGQGQQQQAGLANAFKGVSGLGSALSKSGLGDSFSDFTQDTLGFARGGLVPMRRGYDDGGVVTPDALMFDPNALGGAGGTMAAGLGAAQMPAAFSAPSQGLGAAFPPPGSPAPQGLGAPPPPSSAPPSQGLGAATYADLPTFAQGLGGVFSFSPPTQAPRTLGDAAMPPSSGGLFPSAAPPPSGGLFPVAAAPNARAYTGGDGQGLGAAGITDPRAATGLGAINAAAAPSQDPMGGYAARVRSLESGGNDGASNASGATGRYQFMPSTWNGLRQSHPDLGLTMEGINDPGQQDRAMAALTADNATSMTKALGRAPNPGELYLAHQQGTAGATGLLSNPNARAGDIVGDSAVSANGGDPNMKAGDFAGMWTSRFNGTGGLGNLGNARAYAGAGLGGGYSGGLVAASQAGAQAAGGYAGGLGDAAKLLQPSPGFGQGLGAAALDKIGSALGYSDGHGGGLSNLLPSMPNDTRMGLMSMAAGMMASPSKSVGMAIGHGAQQGIKTYQDTINQQRQMALARASLVNTGSEVGYRKTLGDVDQQRVSQEGSNYQSEDRFRQAQADIARIEANKNRYLVIPDPNPNSTGIRYFDKANPNAGLQTTPSGSGTNPAAAAGGAGALPASSPSVGTNPTGGPPAPGAASGPSSLGSADFAKTGRPILSAPPGYLPTTYYQSQMRLSQDTVARGAAEAQSKEDVTNASVAAQKANSALFYSDEMDRNMDTLAKGGLLRPGAAFPERLNLAKSLNLATSSLGLGDVVDANNVKAGEGLIKDKTRLASQLTSSLGSREAASVFGAMMSATPGGDNSTAGYRGISASIRVLAQRDVDRNRFIQDYATRYGSTGEADVVFNKANPPMAYAQHAQALAKIPQQASDLLRAHANDPRAINAFEQQYGSGMSRYYTGQ